MTRLSTVKALAATVLLGLGLVACESVEERVHARLASPDGRYEAVLMVCQMPADAAIAELVVAVFEDKGRDCRSPYRHALTGVTLTHPYSSNEAKAKIHWVGDRLILNSEAERQMISGTFVGQSQKGIILLEGPIADTYDWNSKQG